MKVKVNVFVWKASKDQLDLVDRILGVLASEKLEFGVQDVSSFKPDKDDYSPTIVFGPMAAGQTGEVHAIPLFWGLPDLKWLEDTPENKTTRVDTFKKLKELRGKLIKYSEQIEEPIETVVEFDPEAYHAMEEQIAHLETKLAATIGIGVGDIQLTQSELDNLLKIKKLLDGGKIVIKKGDLRIEIDDAGKTV